MLRQDGTGSFTLQQHICKCCQRSEGLTKSSFAVAAIVTFEHAGASQICRMVISPARGLRSSISCVEKLSHHRGRLLLTDQYDTVHIRWLPSMASCATAIVLLNSHCG